MTPKQRVILFVFAGRRGNMELQVPMVRRILEEHPNVEYQVWSLPRNDADDRYLQGITGERINVRYDFSNIPRSGHHERPFSAIFRHYTQPEYRDCSFVKIDDDIVFLQTQRFGAFLKAIDAHRGSILSANVINNGACTPLEPNLWMQFKKLGLPLLDVHMSNEYEGIAHGYFFEHYTEMLDQPVELIPTRDWLSINAIGYDWRMASKIADQLGTPHPHFIAGREFPTNSAMGDEGVVNTLPRIIMRGFLAGHLTFCPQYPTEKQLTFWRKHYRQLGERYLNSVPKDDGREELPGLSAISHAQLIPVVPKNWRDRWGASADENDPTAGRYKP
jgi:hypothetical protein